MLLLDTVKLELEAAELLLRIDELLLVPLPAFILGSSGLLNSNEVQENV
jgi:hypothetical protein